MYFYIDMVKIVNYALAATFLSDLIEIKVSIATRKARITRIVETTGITG